jgi:hypothetical protein
MRWFFEVALIGIASSWKWLLASVVVVGALVGILFAAGVFGGGGDVDSPLVTADSPTPTPAAAATKTPTPAPATKPTTVPAPKFISVPILATLAKNVGSLEFVLVYDPAKLEFAQMEPGVLTGSALIDSSSSQPGRVWAGIVDVEGITGSGPVAVVKFNILERSAGDLPLTLENIAAFDASTLVDIVTATTPGQFNTSGLALLSPIVTFQ